MDRFNYGEIKLGNRLVGHHHPVFIIAEAGVNHNGDLKRALDMVDVAAEAGADAVKFQSFVTEAIITRSAPKAAYQHRTTSANESQFDMLKRLELSEAHHGQLMEHCQGRGIMFLSTPYDLASADLLERLDVPALKIASTDTTNLPFLEEVARKGRPILLSTGMCSLGEVEEAVFTVWSTGNRNLVLLQCTAQYPTPLAEVNLKAISTMEMAFGCPVGFSDHTPGLGAAPWAVAVGACLIEKHFTLSRNLPGPDHAASLEPAELRELVRTIRDVETALGDGVKRVMPCELSNKRTHQKSLVVCKPIAAGEIITRDYLTCKRPGTGLPPRWMSKVVSMRAARDLHPDEIVDWHMFVHG